MGKLIDKAKGGLNEAAGKLTQHSSDPATREDGREQELKGKAQQLKGTIEGALGDKV